VLGLRIKKGLKRSNGDYLNWDYLDLNGENLDKLPPLDTNLNRLYCDNNRLTQLGELPKGLMRSEL
jgi:Leucine-rich repeat (LRR) protein